MARLLAASASSGGRSSLPDGTGADSDHDAPLAQLPPLAGPGSSPAASPLRLSGHGAGSSRTASSASSASTATTTLDRPASFTEADGGALRNWHSGGGSTGSSNGGLDGGAASGVSSVAEQFFMWYWSSNPDLVLRRAAVEQRIERLCLPLVAIFRRNQEKVSLK